MVTNRFDIKNVNKRDILAGLLVLIVAGIVVYMFVKPNVPKTNITLPTVRPTEKIENKLNEVKENWKSYANRLLLIIK